MAMDAYRVRKNLGRQYKTQMSSSHLVDVILRNIFSLSQFHHPLSNPCQFFTITYRDLADITKLSVLLLTTFYFQEAIQRGLILKSEVLGRSLSFILYKFGEHEQEDLVSSSVKMAYKNT